MSDGYKDEVKRILMEGGCKSMTEWSEKHTGEHIDVFHARSGFTICAVCGLVRPESGHKYPCRGVARIGLRDG